MLAILATHTRTHMWQPFTADFLKRYFSEIAKKKEKKKKKRKRKNKNRKENTKRHKIAKLTNSGSPQSRNKKKRVTA